MPQVKHKKKSKVKQLCSAYAGVSTVPVLEHAAKQMKWRLTDNPHPTASCYWVCQKDRVMQLVSELPPTQLIARYPKMQAFCNKAPFTAILGQAALLFPEEFYFWPRSYTIPADGEALKETMGGSKKNEFFIVKPDEGSQGDGIFLTSSWNDMVSRLGGFPPSGNWVVQHYMADPYLIDGMKFDLRLYVLLTSVGKSFRAFLSKEGLVRLCTAKYSPPTEKTRHKVTSHLTNYSLNKKSDGFVRGEEDDETGGEGSKRSLTSLLKLLRDNGEDVEDLWSNLTTLIANTIAAMHGPLMEAWEVLGSSGGNLFQVLGFDVLLDAQLNPILLEVNNQPSMAIDTPVPLDDGLCIEQDSMSAAAGFDIPSWLDLSAVSCSSAEAREGNASRDTSTASSRAGSDMTRSSYGSSSVSSENEDEEEPVHCPETSGRLPTPPWANDILGELDSLAKEFIKSSFQEKGKTNPAFSVETETAANDSSESSGDESDSPQSPRSKSARELSLIAEEPVLPPRRGLHAGSSCRQLGTKKQLTPRQTGSHPKGRSRKDSTSKIPNQSKSASSLATRSPPPGAVPKAGSKVESGSKGRSVSKATSSTTAAANDSNGRASPKPPLVPRNVGTETLTENERAASKARPWGGGSGAKKPVYVPSKIPKPALRLNSRDSNSSSNSGTGQAPLKSSRSSRQIRNEELKQARVCNCKELQVPHRHLSSPVDLFVKLGTLSAALELVDNLQQGNDAMAGERAREQFEECFPCLENDNTASLGDGENLLDPSGEQLCASPVLHRAYEVFKECTTTKGNSAGSRLRSIQPFKVRRLATTSKLIAPAGCLKTVDIDILYRQWADRETPVQAAGSDFLNFVDLLMKLAERGLPDASPIDGLVCLLGGETGPGGTNPQ